MSSAPSSGLPPGGEIRLVAAARMLVRAATREAQRRLRERGVERVTPFDSVVLVLLLHDGDARATDLAEKMGVSKQALQRPLKRMHAEGFIETVTDPTDRRAQLVRLSGTGRSVASAVIEIAEEIDSGWEGMVAPSQLAACKRVLLILAARIDREV